MTKDNYKFKFSVIIPVYKVEEYVAETIDSVIDQTIGFEENIQIIIVNDGSPDNSEKVCLKYAKQYPKNIKYILQENSGVSSARNNGLNYVEGKYINFLDSDDKWENDVFEKAWKMFEENDDLDVIGVRQQYFEGSTSFPSLDFKFDEDKIVDINEAYDHIQLSVTSGFFRTSAIGDIRYDTRVKYSEDAKFINEVLFKNCKLGIIASSLHLYRKRMSENSAIQTKNFKDDWYLITTELCYKHAIELSKEKFGKVIKYVQYYIAYDYQWRLKEGVPDVVSDETVEKYKKITKELLDEIDDQIYFEQKRINADIKLEYLKIKYGEKVLDKLVYNPKRKSLFLDKLYCYNLEKNKFVNLNIVNFNEDEVELRGLVNINLPKHLYNINIVVDNKKRIKLDLIDTKINEKSVFKTPYMSSKGFDVKIKLKDLKSLYFEFEFKNETRIKIKFNDNVDTRISPKTRIYYQHNDKIYYYYKGKILTKNRNIKNRVYFCLRNTKFNILNKEFGVIYDRFIYSILKRLKRKDIWIISDRPDQANDNGYALFKHLQENKIKGVKTYFVIDKKSPDYKKVKKTGKCLKYNSHKYKIYFMLAKKIISSQADNWTNNPFGTRARFYQDLFKNKFYFLQHGIIKDDLSVWLNKYQKNLSFFLTSVQDEYESIVNGNYGFGKDVVKLTGMPRYDLLENKEEKLIVFMPTWRANLSTKIDVKTGKRTYNSSFKTSEYFKFYNNLINDKMLIKTLKKHKYKGLFVMHSGHLANLIDFDKNKTIEIIEGNINYSEIFKKASLLITDFSSVAFDFGYLKKPVIYTQFDKDTFYQGQIYAEGYFSYEENGFGPVIYDYEKTKKQIIKYIENECKLEKKYEKRIDKFFKYIDRDNCARVVEIIKEYQ